MVLYFICHGMSPGEKKLEHSNARGSKGCQAGESIPRLASIPSSSTDCPPYQKSRVYRSPQIQSTTRLSKTLSTLGKSEDHCQNAFYQKQ
jgi:hypothetical protein